MFVAEYEQLNFIEDCKEIPKIMKTITLYLVKYTENDVIKDKNHFLDCAVGYKNCRPIIVIIYNEYTFLKNDSI